MKKTTLVLAIAALFPASAFAAVTKDGGQPSVNPCDAKAGACKGDAPQAAVAEEAVNEPMVIFLDAEGNTLVRMPLSKFRKAQPEAKLPANVDSLR